MAEKPLKTAQLIFPHQLFQEISFLEKEIPVFLVEEFLFFKQYTFHQQKLAFHRATMKFYENFLLEKGFKVHYIESISELSDIRNLIPFLEQEGFEKIKIIDVCDDWLEKRILKTKLKVEIIENPSFINPKEDLKVYFEGKKHYHQTDFYKQQRISRNILLENGKPVGGKWTFDTENRKKYPKNKKSPSISFPQNNHFYEEAKIYVSKNFRNHYGELTDYQIYPTTFSESEIWLENFLENRFLEFGIYEDSIVENEHFLHHSVLSPLMNVGLLTPEYVLEKAIAFAEENDIPVNSLEGFVRQILGWREFVRGVYVYQGTYQRNKNYWKHDKKLPESFYTAKTGIRPIDSSLQKILKTGYAHHIERLMIFANFMNLAQFNPDEVYQWFMEMFIDSYDWVMVPNVYGMSSFSDGGKMSTKPYISGSNYIKKMSDYPDGEWNEKWDALFWNFINDHQDFFAKNPRLGMMLRTLEKMPEEKRKQHFKTAKEVIGNMK
jgi:deoxyribodipyrimidine photolyase-related protein